MTNKLIMKQNSDIQVRLTPHSIQNNCREKRWFNLILNLGFILLIVTVLSLNTEIANAQSGQQPPRVTGEGAENISLYSGRLNFNLPLISVGGRGVNSTDLNLHIKEKPWNVLENYRNYDSQGNLISISYIARGYSEVDPVNVSDYTPMTLSVVGRNNFTWTSNGGAATVLELKTDDGNTIVLRDNIIDGQIRDVSPAVWGDSFKCLTQFDWQTWTVAPPSASCSRGKEFHSADGSAMSFVADENIYDAVYSDPYSGAMMTQGGYGNATGYLYTADGTRYRFVGGIPIWSQDRNGNRTSFSYFTPSWANGIIDCSNPSVSSGSSNSTLVGVCKLSKIIDSINREVIITYGDVINESYYDTISYKGFGGNNRQIKIYYGRMGNSLAPGENLDTPDNLFPISNVSVNIQNASSYSTSQKTTSDNSNIRQKQQNETSGEKSLEAADKYLKKSDADKEWRYQRKLSINPRAFPRNLNIPDEVQNKLRISLFRNKQNNSGSQNNNDPSAAQLSSICDPDIDPECVNNNGANSNSKSSISNTAYTGELFNPMVVQKVVLPNEQNYQFKYNRYGELARVIVPTGGYTDYEYGALPNPRDTSGLATSERTEANGLIWGSFSWQNYESPLMIYRRITQKKTYDYQGALESKTDFSDVGYLNPAIVKTYEPNGTVIEMTKHHFFQQGMESAFTAAGAYGYWKINKEFKTESLNPNNPSTVLESVDLTWTQRSPITWGNTSNYFLASPEPENDPRITEVKTTLETGQVSSKVFNYDQYNNLTDTYEYDFGNGTPGAFLQRSHTDYINNTNYTSYTGAHLRRLPAQNWVSSDTQGTNIVSLTQNEYDNYASNTTHAPLLNRSGVSGHDTGYGDGNPWRGNITGVTSFANAATQSDAISIFSQYDILGNVVKVIDAKGNSTTINYNDNFGAPDAEARTNLSPSQLSGNQTFAFATSAVNSFGWTTFAQIDYFLGLPVEREGISGNVNSSFYNDILDRPTQTIAANNTNLRHQTSISYDDVNRRITTTSDLFAFGDNGSKSEGFYDSLGRTREIRKYEENGAYVSALTAYDALGRKKAFTNPFRPAQNEQQLWTSINRDSLGRTISIVAPDGSAVTTSYSGSTTISTDQANKQRRSISNALGQLIRIDEPDDAGNLGTTSNPTQPTYYNYDTMGDLVKVTQGQQNRFFKYDSIGRLIRVNQPEQTPNPNLSLADSVSGNNQWTSGATYDANGNILTSTDAKGIVTSNTYDLLNRPLVCSYSDGTPSIFNVYDNPAVPFSKGKLTSISNSNSTAQTTAYDNLGRVTASQQITDGQSYNFGYSYTLAGALVEETYPSGRKVKNSFEADGDLAIVQTQPFNGGWETIVDSVTRLSAGAINSLRLGNNRWESTQFNSRLQPVQISIGSGQYATDLLKLNYDYGTIDNNGNIKSQTIAAPGLSPFVQSYAYDSLNRLKLTQEANNGGQIWQQAFQYDRYGNRRFDVSNTTFPSFASPNVTNPNIDSSTNRFVAGQGYTYDLNGNIIQDAQGRQFTFNGDNKQIEVRNSSNQVVGQYFYDGQGKRVKKITGSEVTIFVYSAGKLAAEYALGSSDPSAPATKYITSDTLGSPRIITNQDGSVQSRRDFMPFGEDENNFGGRSPATGYQSDTIRQKYAGYEKDDETGLNFAEARYYNNLQGRFTAVDPFLASGQSSNPQSFNRYSYVNNNPINDTDSTGMWSDSQWNSISGGFFNPPTLSLSLNADYYDKDTGEYLGNDGVNDHRVVTGKAVSSYQEGKTIHRRVEQLHDLGITDTQFNTISNIIRQEGLSNDAEEYLWIAHASNNAAQESKTSFYKKVMSGYSSVKSDQKTPLNPNDGSVQANAARAGVINVLSGGEDPTMGADLWDGTDFLAWGLNSPDGTPQNKFEEYSKITVPAEVYGTFLAAQRSYWGPTARYGTRTFNLPADVFNDSANWKKYGSYSTNFEYNTGQRGKKSLYATGTRGLSIFWKRY